jgi:hypothetical protein
MAPPKGTPKSGRQKGTKNKIPNDLKELARGSPFMLIANRRGLAGSRKSLTGHAARRALAQTDRFAEYSVSNS